jgi:hypothetical protein
MHVNKVADYAPPGYRLTRTDYADGVCMHTFEADGRMPVSCSGSWPTADDELAALEAFQAHHTAASRAASQQTSEPVTSVERVQTRKRS